MRGMNTKFNWVLRPIDGSVDFGPELNEQLPLLIRKLMAQRGICGREMAESYLRPRLADLGDPFVMQEMAAAVERIFRAVDAGESVCIYGDYDVDGVSSVTLLHDLLVAYGLRPTCFIPVRTQEGYGLSQPGIDHAMASCERRPTLLIAVDCGSSSVDEVDYLNSLGVDAVILDHHEGGTRGRPRAVAVVNAKLEADSPLTYLCSAGVVFKLAHAMLKRRRLQHFDLREHLDVVAVATVADIVPMVHENRLLTRVGLRLLGHERGNVGLRALAGVTGLRLPPSASHVSFRIGPRLNAAGRMDSPQDALDLLMSRDSARAGELAMHLDSHNKARQAEEERIRLEAIRLLEESDFDAARDHVIVLGSRNWHPGVVGIVASVIMRRYHKPTFIISIDEDGVGKGSGRSIPGISLVEAIHACADTLIAGGGHDMAAGLEVREEMLPAFRRAFDAYVATHASPEQLAPVLDIDTEVSFSELSVGLLESYALLEPFGNGNPQPVFMSRNVMLSDAPKHLSGNHLRLCLRQGPYEQDALFFNAGDLRLPDPPWDIAFTVDRNDWKGRTFLSIFIQDIRPAEPTA